MILIETCNEKHEDSAAINNVLFVKYFNYALHEKNLRMKMLSGDEVGNMIHKLVSQSLQRANSKFMRFHFHAMLLPNRWNCKLILINFTIAIPNLTIFFAIKTWHRWPRFLEMCENYCVIRSFLLLQAIGWSSAVAGYETCSMHF